MPFRDSFSTPARLSSRTRNICTGYHTKHHIMPGRTSARPPSASRLSNKASSQKLSSRRTTAAPIDIPIDGPSTSLRTRICEIFSDAQKSTAGHRKLATSLRKLQEGCCYELPHARGQKNRAEEFGEDDFNVEVTRCVICLMGVKKSEGVGDRVVTFLGLFLRRATEKGELVASPTGESGLLTFVGPRCRSCASRRGRRNADVTRDAQYAIDVAHPIDLTTVIGFQREGRAIPSYPACCAHRQLFGLGRR